MKALLVEPGISQPRQVEYFSLEDLQRLVGGYIEALTPVTECFVMYVDEEGKLKNKPVNYGANNLCAVYGIHLADDDFIVGNAIISGPIDKNGDDTSLPDAVAEEISRKIFNAGG